MQYWLPGSPESMFTFTTQHVVIEFPERTSDCPEPKTLKKISTKNRDIAIPMTRGSLRDWPCLKDLALIWWISARFFDAGEICELRLHTVTCLASLYVGKQHRTNNEPQNLIIWPWIEHRFQRKSTATGPSSRKYNLYLFSYLYFYVLTTILNFSYNVFKSFVMCKTVSKLVVIYAPSLGRLWFFSYKSF